MRKRRKVAQLAVLSDAAKPENWTRVGIRHFWKASQRNRKIQEVRTNCFGATLQPAHANSYGMHESARYISIYIITKSMHAL